MLWRRIEEISTSRWPLHAAHAIRAISGNHDYEKALVNSSRKAMALRTLVAMGIGVAMNISYRQLMSGEMTAAAAVTSASQWRSRILEDGESHGDMLWAR